MTVGTGFAPLRVNLKACGEDLGVLPPCPGGIVDLHCEGFRDSAQEPVGFRSHFSRSSNGEARGAGRILAWAVRPREAPHKRSSAEGAEDSRIGKMAYT
jgi:hypothetical protein